MSFRPVLPYSGSDGWGYLKDTLGTQRAAYDAAIPTLEQIDLAAFRARIAATDTAAKLADDAPLWRVALEAFGLGDARPTRAFLEKTLNTSTKGAGAEARFADARWFALAQAFGYGDGTAKTGEAGFADTVVARWRIMGFEKAVGAADPAMRQALAFDRAAASLAAGKFPQADGWARAEADPAIRSVLKQALGLGSAFDLAAPQERAAMLRDGMAKLGGGAKVDGFADAALRDTALKAFFEAAKRPASVGGPVGRVGEGLAGWRALQGSLSVRRDAFARTADADPGLKRFVARVGAVESAEDFVRDAEMVEVALEAFGLSRAAPTAAFLRQVLESDPDNAASFAGRQADPRWREMAAVFGFGAGSGAKVAEFGFAEDFAARWRIAAFEEAAGAQDDDLRMALIADRTLAALAGAGLDADEGWRRALASPTLAHVIGRGLGLGEEFATLGREAQVERAQAAAKTLTGAEGLEGFAQAGARDRLARAFLSADPTAERPRGVGQPVLPLGGMAGWAYLKRTLATQQESFAQSVAVRRETDYFRETIGRIGSAKELVADRRLLTVALDAYGLGDEIGKRAFIEKALTEGTENPRALAARLSDPRYRAFVKDFGFGDAQGAQTGRDGFADAVLARHRVRSFEKAVGESNESMRLALNFDREIATLARSGSSEQALWFRVLGEPPLRKVLEGAFNLPAEFSQIPVDRQAEVLKARTRRTLGGGFATFADPAKRETALRRFLVREELGQTTAGAASRFTALSMLQAIPSASLNRRV
jgi:hypothetical protein